MAFRPELAAQNLRSNPKTKSFGLWGNTTRTERSSDRVNNRISNTIFLANSMKNENADSTQKDLFWVPATVFFLVVVIGAVSRFLLMDYPNFKPVAAMALFAGFYFKSFRTAAVAILSMMLISDAVLGFYDLPIMTAVYSSLLIAGGLGLWVRRQFLSRSLPSSFAGTLASSLAMSTIFFLLTNAATWWMWYGHSWPELIECYTAAIPFYRATLGSDLMFTFGWASLYHWALYRSEIAERTKLDSPESTQSDAKNGFSLS